ncbi:DUF2231 domain-containing protein [Piscinibacter sakaiensis]|uniref:Succinate dehydrogenase, cytochrome b subunit family protein n=1 Tax=Piscinibacter sakaiensis TaxID=1547922 RepID=A0A0K8P0L4_PISS1|nr:DUF2231 domain-containing protein [Piscinibacter sakaiensis]GAP36163.1 succinate dehydrogenase, cytochrome b subunit family protein [Piscinibacter sakaiensis]
MHANLAFSTLPLYLGALLCDAAYARTAEVQWSNFASWLIAWGLVFNGLALIWALVAWLLSRRERWRHRTSYLLMLAGSVVLAVVNALVHARDAWATMPAAPVVSALVFLLAAAAAGVGLAAPRPLGRTPAGAAP